VANKGEGINSRDLSKIFDRFYRTETSRSSAGAAGYGLGLSLAKEIVNLHDGSISATSAPGKTTTLTVTLPQVRKNR
jgi:two-component system OmpR family sensor kinase